MDDSDASTLFLRDLLHELKDPFAAIHGGLELSGHQPGLAAPQRERLQQSMLRNSLVMKRVLEEASLYLQLVSGAYTVSSSPTRALALLKQAVQEVEAQLEMRSQTVVIRGPELDWDIDAGALRRLGAVVLASMSRVCSHGETMEMRLGLPQNGSLTVDLSPAGREPRPRGESSDFRQELAQRLALALGGEARRQALDAWTLRLPFQAAAGQATEAPAPRLLAARPLKVLIVDDNRDGADTLAMWLEAKGFSVATAYDGESGLEELRRYRPEIGLFDLNLPGKSGCEMARAARAEGFAGTLVATTGADQERDQAAALDSGFDRCMLKPVDLAVLEELLKRLSSLTPPRRVLVVEDNPMARQVLLMMLVKAGMDAVAASSAEEGLEEIARQPPDLVFCDLGLPGRMDGYDLALRVRQNAALQGLPLFALTGDAAGAQQRARQAGFDRVLEKPLDQATLHTLLQAAAPLSGP
jgi:CheY-like chemotaxis protein